MRRASWLRIQAYYTFVLAPWLRLSANPEVKPTNGANKSMWVGGLRARLAF